jgi:hypothetical protein
MASHPEVGVWAPRHALLDSTGVPDRDVGEVTAEPVSRASLLMSNNFFAPTMIMLKRELPQRFLSGRRHVDDHLLWLQIVLSGHAFTRLSAKLAYTYKRPYGQGGLSGQLWQMEKAELDNYWILRSEGRIGLPAALGLSAWSLAKFLRRLLLVSLRRAQRLL